MGLLDARTLRRPDRRGAGAGQGPARLCTAEVRLLRALPDQSIDVGEVPPSLQAQWSQGRSDRCRARAGAAAASPRQAPTAQAAKRADAHAAVPGRTTPQVGQ